MDGDDQEEDVVISKKEHMSLLEEISHLSDSLKKLQLKAETMGHTDN